MNGVSRQIFYFNQAGIENTDDVVETVYEPSERRGYQERCRREFSAEARVSSLPGGCRGRRNLVVVSSIRGRSAQNR